MVVIKSDEAVVVDVSLGGGGGDTTPPEPI
jgi:hypothetical protein